MTRFGDGDHSPTRGLLLVYTGKGKGKTTAACGLALRGWAQGWSIGIIQFMKSGKWPTGERTALETLAATQATPSRITWQVAGTGGSWSPASGSPADRATAAQEGWSQARQQLSGTGPQLLILDELCLVLNQGWVDLNEVLTALQERPASQHVVITGRDAPEPLCQAADLVSVVEERKHPYHEGIHGQGGIEW